MSSSFQVIRDFFTNACPELPEDHLLIQQDFYQLLPQLTRLDSSIFLEDLLLTICSQYQYYTTEVLNCKPQN